jgi:hypothetical protein
MRFLRSSTLLAVTGALTVACSPDAVTGSASPRVPTTPTAPAFDYNSSAPVPEVVSATLIDKSTVRITFNDTALDESLVSAYFTPDASYNNAATLNIAGTSSTGQRTVDLALPAGSTTVRLRNGWSSSSASTGIVWGAFSGAATITSSTGSSAVKAKGHRK